MAELEGTCEAGPVVEGQGQGDRAGPEHDGTKGPRQGPIGRAVIERHEQRKEKGEERPAPDREGEEEVARPGEAHSLAVLRDEQEADRGQAVAEALPVRPDVGPDAGRVEVGAEHEGQAREQRGALVPPAAPQDHELACEGQEPDR